MMIVKIRDFEKEDGSVDWDAYHKAEVANGDRCMTCGGFTFNSILHDDCGPSECNSCKSMASDDDEVSHDSKGLERSLKIVQYVINAAYAAGDLGLMEEPG